MDTSTKFYLAFVGVVIFIMGAFIGVGSTNAENRKNCHNALGAYPYNEVKEYCDNILSGKLRVKAGV